MEINKNIDTKTTEIRYVTTRIGGAEYQVTLPMSRQTMEVLKQAQSGRPAKATEQIRPVTKNRPS